MWEWLKRKRIEERVGDGSLLFIRGTRTSKSVSIVLRGANEYLLDEMDRALHDVLAAKLPGRDFSYFLTQRGMFSYTGLTPAQVDRLRDEFGVYLVRSGRMCVAGLNDGNVARTAEAMAAVLAA